MIYCHGDKSYPCLVGIGLSLGWHCIAIREKNLVLCSGGLPLLPNGGCQLQNLLGCDQGKLKQGISDDDVTVRPWLPSNIFLVVSMI